MKYKVSKKENQTPIKISVVGLADWFVGLNSRQNRFKNKLAGENAVIGVHIEDALPG